MSASTVNVASSRHLAVAGRALDEMSERFRGMFAEGTWRTQPDCSPNHAIKPTKAGYAKPTNDGIRLPRGTG